MPATNTCQYQDCPQSIRAGHHLCRNHYYESQGGVISACSGCGQVYKPTEYDVCRSCYGNRSVRQSQQVREWPQPYREARQLSPELRRLREEISGVRRVILNNPKSINDSERATEQHCVIPILRGLGWDVHSPHELVPQHRVTRSRGLRVDFALHIDGKPVILVEVKRHGIEYDPSWEQQLMQYIAYMTSGFGVLTNGQIWLIYDVLGHGDAEHINTVDIIDDSLDALVAFQRLSKENLTDSSAYQSVRNVRRKARSDFDNRRPVPASTLRPPSDDELTKRLENYRSKERSRRGVAPYVIFNRNTIENIVASRPSNIQQLRQVSGVGAITLERYGDDIIKIVNSPVRL